MSEWWKSISARLEGRSAVIALCLIFCAFLMWLFLLHGYSEHPDLSTGFMVATFLLGIAVIVVALLVKPVPSEVSQKYLLQQIGQQVVVASGFQSHSELIEVLREVHNIRDLPPPAALVKGGSATNEKNYQELSSEEARQIAERDQEGVNRMLSEESKNLIQSSGASGEISGQPPFALTQAPPDTSASAPE